VLLLDEPFGALDAKIRSELRRSLRAIQRELKLTTIFVTHDQEEGLELADRLGVMDFGRLLEVAVPAELYRRPQTEFVATFLGKANLLLGVCDKSGVRLGNVHWPLDGAVSAGDAERRVQVLFRPEDVAVKDSAEALTWPALGQAIVQEVGFSAAMEKLRLRLPALPGVRAIAPESPFGADYLVLDAVRSQHQARRFPLQPGQIAWVGVRRVHALPDLGSSFLLVLDGTPNAEGALWLGARMARLAHARVSVLGLGRSAEVVQRSREALGSGLAALELHVDDGDLHDALQRSAARRAFDLVIHGRPERDAADVATRVLNAGNHHLLLVPSRASVPRRALICVAAGEPGKDDVLFAGRLVRHVGATATLLTVRPRQAPAEALAQAGRFLEAGVRTLSLLGVEALARLRQGRTQDEIVREVAGGGHDLIVLGTPAAASDGKLRLDGLIRRLLDELPPIPVLLVGSQRPQREQVVRSAAVGCV
jgi:sulfate transport system ATP-binding protein